MIGKADGATVFPESVSRMKRDVSRAYQRLCAYPIRGGFFSSLRCSVRRCIFSARAVAEMLPS
jgi:hypothetical protein